MSGKGKGENVVKDGDGKDKAKSINMKKESKSEVGRVEPPKANAREVRSAEIAAAPKTTPVEPVRDKGKEALREPKEKNKPQKLSADTRETDLPTLKSPESVEGARKETDKEASEGWVVREPKKIRFRSPLPLKKKPRKLEYRSGPIDPRPPRQEAVVLKKKPRKLEIRSGPIDSRPLRQDMVKLTFTSVADKSSSPAMPSPQAVAGKKPAKTDVIKVGSSKPTTTTTQPPREATDRATKPTTNLPLRPSQVKQKEREQVPYRDDEFLLDSPISEPFSDRSRTSLETFNLESGFSQPESFRMEVATDTRNDQRYYVRTKLRIDNKFIDDIEEFHKEEWRTLMLYQGQGGTFGFGDRFQDEKGNWVTINSFADARKSTSQTKHLLYFGGGHNVEFVGTRGCHTCVGVYFEIVGNRVFCAHINSYHYQSRSQRNPLEIESEAYWNIRNDVYRRLVEHAHEFGWAELHEDGPYISKFVKKNTLKMVCPHEEISGYAVRHAIEDFLDIEHTPTIPAHGFAIIPGILDGNQKPRGKLFLYAHTVQWSDASLSEIFDEVPSVIKKIRYVDRFDIYELQPWTYTAGLGWEWTNSRGEGTRGPIEPGRVRFYRDAPGRDDSDEDSEDEKDEE